VVKAIEDQQQQKCGAHNCVGLGWAARTGVPLLYLAQMVACTFLGENKRSTLFDRLSESKKKPEHSAAPFTKRVLDEAVSASELHPKVLPSAVCGNSVTQTPVTVPRAVGTTASGCRQGRVSVCMPAGRAGWPQPARKYWLHSSNRAVRQRCSGLSWGGWREAFSP